MYAQGDNNAVSASYDSTAAAADDAPSQHGAYAELSGLHSGLETEAAAGPSAGQVLAMAASAGPDWRVSTLIDQTAQVC